MLVSRTPQTVPSRTSVNGPLLSHGGDPGVDGLLFSLHQLDVRQDLVDVVGGHLYVVLTD